MRWIRHRAPYFVMVIVIALGVGTVNRQQDKDCKQTQVMWDLNSKQNTILTQPSKISAGAKNNTDIQAQIVAVNIRKSKQRVKLTEALGPRPVC